MFRSTFDQTPALVRQTTVDYLSKKQTEACNYMEKMGVKLTPELTEAINAFGARLKGATQAEVYAHTDALKTQIAILSGRSEQRPPRIQR